jgi:predicted HD phosphohydrolase
VDLRGLLELARGITHEGQEVDQYTHALRCATIAHEHHAERQMIVVALVHDLAKPLGVEFHGEAMAAALQDVLEWRYVQLLRYHGDFVAVLNAGRELASDGYASEHIRLGHRFAYWDHEALRPGPLDEGLVDEVEDWLRRHGA